MANSLMLTNNISFILVLLEGFLSFFSPCVVPLIPIYISYLAGNTDNVDESGKITYNRKKVFFHTVCFVLGISFAFFILGMTFSTVGAFFKSNQLLFSKIAGIIIIMLGLFQLGILSSKILHRERKFHMNLSTKKANPLTALILGFTFSFAWTPCVGPALSSVLILASSANSTLIGNALVLVYTVGFIVPFLLLGLFTTQVLNFLDRHQNILKYTVKTGGIILIVMGIMTLTGWMNNITGYFNSYGSKNVPENNNTQQQQEKDDQSEESEQKVFPAVDFTLVDQYGNTHKLSDYKGKVVFLNFWATWCPPCREEMPDIEKLYNEFNKNQGDVIFLGVSSPRSKQNSNTREVDKDGVIKFLKENGYTFPVVFDETGEVYAQYGITALPTTFMINKEGNIEGYVPGMLTLDMMRNIIEQTLNATN